MIAVVEVRTVRTRIDREVRLNHRNIRELLEQQGLDIPTNARITIDVPGGGDWSNTSLDVDDANPVVITWSETQEESNV